MKILMMARRCEPLVGGVEKHLKEVSVRVRGRGHEVKIIAEEGRPDYLLPNNSKLARWLWLWKNREIMDWADIIHIHDVFYWYLPFLWLGKKVFITFHGYEGNDAPNWKQIFWHRLAAKLTRGNICIGDFHKKWYGVKPNFVSYGAA